MVHRGEAHLEGLMDELVGGMEAPQGAQAVDARAVADAQAAGAAPVIA